ncbi:hypothetical protein, partial [Mucilaginibacter sp. 5C4]|uniref:hypothetical protein n=1 Tax=Mucilaginibacter sp. 5C4 TaxID=3048589 RepID=UPI002B239F09
YETHTPKTREKKRNHAILTKYLPLKHHRSFYQSYQTVRKITSQRFAAWRTALGGSPAKTAPGSAMFVLRRVPARRVAIF